MADVGAHLSERVEMSEYSTGAHLSTLLARYGLAGNKSAEEEFYAFAMRQRYLGISMASHVVKLTAAEEVSFWERAHGTLGKGGS